MFVVDCERMKLTRVTHIRINQGYFNLFKQTAFSTLYIITHTMLPAYTRYQAPNELGYSQEMMQI